MQAAEQVEIVHLPEMKLVGVAVTSPFQGHKPDRVEAMKRQFFERRHDIPNVIRPERYISPSFGSDVLFTYLIAMEVSDLTAVPADMFGFTVPPRRYAKTKSSTDPFQAILEYIKANDLQNDNRALALEIYPFANPVWPDQADVYVPLK